MSDFRIYDLNSYNNVLDVNTFLADDRNAFTSSKKLDISSLSNIKYFYYVYYNYLNDFIYYENIAKLNFGKLFKINKTNTNINFIETNVGNRIKYTPYTNSYNVDVYSQSNYGEYFTIDKNVDDDEIKVSYNITPNYYSKNDLDTLFECAKFDVKTFDELLKITTSNNDKNYKSSFFIENSGLYTNSSKHSFNPFYSSFGDGKSTMNIGDFYPNNLGGSYGNVFTIIENDKKIYYYAPNVMSIDCSIRDNCYVGGNQLTIIGEKGTFGSFDSCQLTICNSAYRGGDGTTIPRYSIHITDKVLNSDYGSYSYFVLGEWDKKTLFCTYEGRFEFNTSSEYGFYINGNKFFVGTMKDKFPDMSMYLPGEYISFGDNIDGRAITHKFSIGGNYDNYDMHTIFEMNNSLTGVFYKGVNIAERKYDVYETSSYWDLVMNKDKLERDVLYTY